MDPGPWLSPWGRPGSSLLGEDRESRTLCPVAPWCPHGHGSLTKCVAAIASPAPICISAETLASWLWSSWTSPTSTMSRSPWNYWRMSWKTGAIRPASNWLWQPNTGTSSPTPAARCYWRTCGWGGCGWGRTLAWRYLWRGYVVSSDTCGLWLCLAELNTFCGLFHPWLWTTPGGRPCGNPCLTDGEPEPLRWTDSPRIPAVRWRAAPKHGWSNTRAQSAARLACGHGVHSNELCTPGHPLTTKAGTWALCL